MISVVISGGSGRMPGLIARAVREAPDLALCGRLSPRGPAGEADSGTVYASLAEVAAPEPVVIDLTAPERTAWLLDEAACTPCALVIGTSGLDRKVLDSMAALAKTRAVLLAANFSLGMRAARRLARDLAATGGSSWEASVLDIHFKGKVDAPSASARALAEDWSSSREHRLAEPTIASLRQGDGVSEHRLICHAPGEVLEVVHRVNDRRAFLGGILAATRFVHGRAPGLYGMEDL